ncbi:MAG: hypothetical protein K9H25_23095 [Rhodospirillum sp.]|nr:hypothetical protein [Rhodospirillum sp.]MCF8491381.1 hypothetical protein [Rhodospirillum sp.]MCF8500205.1 hypothetical protein [Rhodospirillum sp.]
MTGLFGHLEDAQIAPRYASLEEQARAAECFETPPWAAAQILRVELLTRRVVDPCCGTGVLSEAARAAGYEVESWDLHNWGYQGTEWIGRDFLAVDQVLPEFSVFMNPPFSLACDFVDHARRLGARKILAFQRYAWRESDTRRRWWAKNPPTRVWLCGDRANCWRFDIPPERRQGGAPTAHAWFVWEVGHKGAELGGAIYKSGGIE